MIYASCNDYESPLDVYLKDVLNAAKANYECSPMQPQPPWSELSDDEKIEMMVEVLIDDIEFRDWYFRVVDENDGHQKFSMLMK